jgi:hypothetical protein
MGETTYRIVRATGAVDIEIRRPWGTVQIVSGFRDERQAYAWILLEEQFPELRPTPDPPQDDDDPED